MKFAYVCDIDACLVTMPAGEDLSAILYRPNPDRNGKPIPYWPKGTVRELKGIVCDAVWHCKRGIGVPADEECANALGYTPEQLVQAQHVYKRIVDGIQPEDFAQYDAGVMVGYDSMGNWIPGPNFEKYQAAQKAAENSEGI